MTNRRLPERTSGPAAAILAAIILALTGCDRGETHLDSFTMVDLQAPAMFIHLATGRDRAFVLELPPGTGDLRFDLTMKDVTERQILDELVRRDPSFQHAEPGALVFWPTGKAEASSAYSKRIPRFAKSGGVGDVISALMEAAGSPVEVQAQAAAGRRPVSLEVKDGVLRDVLADIARQAHVGLIIEAGKVNVSPIARLPSLDAAAP